MRVCEKIYPKGFSYNRKPGFYMEEILKEQLDVLLKNIENDWDFTILITGGGQVRVGKSLLTMQIGAYWNRQIKKLYGKNIPFNVEENFVFDGKQLIKKGNYLGKKYDYPCLIYDEAGADLEGRKVMQSTTQDVLDFFRECGQYNMLNIIVLPEFFDLPKGIALSRSICLIDVSYLADDEGIFQRGYFNFYSFPNKKQLYLRGKKELNYKAYHYDFHGRFYHFYPIDEKEYRAKKQEALTRRESKRRNKFQMQRDCDRYLLCYEGLECSCGNKVKLSQQQLAQREEQLTGIFVARNTISYSIRHFLMEGESIKDTE